MLRGLRTSCRSYTGLIIVAYLDLDICIITCFSRLQTLIKIFRSISLVGIHLYTYTQLAKIDDTYFNYPTWIFFRDVSNTFKQFTDIGYFRYWRCQQQHHYQYLLSAASVCMWKQGYQTRYKVLPYKQKTIVFIVQCNGNGIRYTKPILYKYVVYQYRIIRIHQHSNLYEELSK